MESNSAIVVTSTLGEVDVFNPQAEELFGYSKKEVFGNNISFLFSDSLAISEHNTALTTLRKIDDGNEKKHEIGMKFNKKLKIKIYKKIVLKQKNY